MAVLEFCLRSQRGFQAHERLGFEPPARHIERALSGPEAKFTSSLRVRCGVGPTAHARSDIGWRLGRDRSGQRAHVLARVYPSDGVAGRTLAGAHLARALGRPAGPWAAVDNHRRRWR